MTTLISVSTSHGLVGRCDAKCYEAAGAVCECVCGGRNHGAGREQAVDNTRQWAEQWVETYTHQKGWASYLTEIHPDCQQLSLWSSA